VKSLNFKTTLPERKPIIHGNGSEKTKVGKVLFKVLRLLKLQKYKKILVLFMHPKLEESLGYKISTI
jgi:hypothetical protein